MLQENFKNIMEEARNTELKVDDQWLEIFIKEQKLKYFDHLKRSESLGIPILGGKVDGKRERGRPRRQWDKDIRDVFQHVLTEVGRLAIDRNCFH